MDQNELRLMFAAQAPAEIPDWFEVPGTKELPLPQEIGELFEKLSLDEKAWVREWEKDPLVSDLTSLDSSKELLRYEQAVIGYQKAKEARRRQAVVDRYFAWRWFYADKMVEMSL